MQTRPLIPNLVASVASLLALAGCSSSESEPTKLGDLGRGTFQYTCVSDDDVVCGSGAKTKDFTFPTSLAVKGRFKLTFNPKSGFQSQIGNAVLKPASNDFINDDSLDFFRALKPGRVAIVARSSANGKAADLTYVRIAAPAKIRLLDDKSQPSKTRLEVKKGDTFLLRAEARDANDAVLAGTIDFDWETSDPKVVELDAGTPIAKMPFVARELGEATLTVKLDAVTQQVLVTVVAQ